MPQFSVGQMVKLDMDALKPMFSDFLTQTYTDAFGVNTPVEVLKVNDDGITVNLLSTHQLSNGKSRTGATYGGIPASLFKAMGPPETVREMSYKVLSEYQNAAV